MLPVSADCVPVLVDTCCERGKLSGPNDSLQRRTACKNRQLNFESFSTWQVLLKPIFCSKVPISSQDEDKKISEDKSYKKNIPPDKTTLRQVDSSGTEEKSATIFFFFLSSSQLKLKSFHQRDNVGNSWEKSIDWHTA